MNGARKQWGEQDQSCDGSIDVGQQEAFDRFWQAMIAKVIRRWRAELEDQR